MLIALNEVIKIMHFLWEPSNEYEHISDGCCTINLEFVLLTRTGCLKIVQSEKRFPLATIADVI